MQHVWERRGKHRAAMGKSERNKQLGRHRSKWEDNIKMDLYDVVCGAVD
jgi:hypothetical protein